MIGLGVRTNKINAGGTTSPPANTVAPSIPTSIVVGTAITISAGTWTNTPTSYNYKLYRGATLIDEQNSASTSVNYTPLQADASNTANIKAVVTATNAGGSASADSNTVVIVYDEIAYTYIQAVPLTDATLKQAANFEMYTMKAGGVVSGYVGGYPVLGGTAEAHKLNIFNPVDSDAAKRLVYSGTVTHGPNGMQGNAVNGRANTFINPSTDLNGDFAVWFYSRTTSTTGTWADLGVIAGGANPGIAMSVKTNAANAFSANCDINTALAAIANSGGFFLMKRVGNTVTVKRNDVTILTFTAPNTSYQNGVINLMCLSVLPASFVNYSGKQYTDFGFVKATFTTGMDTAVYNAVLGKETILGRNV